MIYNLKWASHVALVVNNLPANVDDPLVKDSLEYEVGTHSLFLPGEFVTEEGAWQAIVHRATRVGHD